MKEEEIRNRDTFDRYLELVAKDVEELLKNDNFQMLPCPACGRSAEFVIEFIKLGFQYVTCPDCATLFVNPRPSFDVLSKFYSDSPSTSFWVNNFFLPVAEARRDKIFKPRAEYICDYLEDQRNIIIGDIGAGFGLFLEELRRILPDNQYYAIEPSHEMAAICRSKGFNTEDYCLEKLAKVHHEKFDLLTAFELLEHLHHPNSFLRQVRSFLKPGGLLFMTTLSGRGFDIQVAWEKSKSIAPPHHLNFFNPDSVVQLFEGCELIIKEVTTPGKLDWDIIEGMVNRDNLYVGRFFKHMATEGYQQTKDDFQKWLQLNRLSSHMQVIARRPG